MFNYRELISVVAAIALVAACPSHRTGRMWSGEGGQDEESAPGSGDSLHWHWRDDGGHRQASGAGKGDIPYNQRTLLLGHGNHRSFDKDRGKKRKGSRHQGLRLCGTKHPSRAELIKLGEAYAKYDIDNPDDEDEHGMYKLHSFVSKITGGKASQTPNMTVPAYFHVFIKNEADVGRLNLTQIQTGMMANARSAFNGTGFQFRIQAVTNYVNVTWAACDDMKTFKAKTRQGGPETLNVWICDLASKGAGGRGTYPPIVVTNKVEDGITLMNPALGNAEFAKQAFVHELGHWFGLLHTFTGRCSSVPAYNFNKYPDYYVTGDGVPDTPAHDKPTWFYSQSSYCWRNDSLDTCPDLPGVDPGLDPVDNYMNYLPGECFRDYGRFTQGQRKRMRAQWLAWRVKK